MLSNIVPWPRGQCLVGIINNNILGLKAKILSENSQKNVFIPSCQLSRSINYEAVAIYHIIKNYTMTSHLYLSSRVTSCLYLTSYATLQYKNQ